MWFFNLCRSLFFPKYKPPRKPEEIKKEKKDRFIVEVYKDGNEYMIITYDTWSRIFFKGKKEGLTHARVTTMQYIVNYAEVLKIIEDDKNILRKRFLKKRNLQLKKKAKD